MAKTYVSTTINGESAEYLCEPQQTLLDVLRDVVGLTGAKEGCASGDCGAVGPREHPKACGPHPAADRRGQLAR